MTTPEPLWSDERIIEAVVSTGLAYTVAIQVRTDYETERAAQSARIAELEQHLRIAVTALAICREQRDEAADANLIMARELTSTDTADRYYRGFNAGYDHAIRTIGKEAQP
jgi:hypothetical protein